MFHSFWNHTRRYHHTAAAAAAAAAVSAFSGTTALVLFSLQSATAPTTGGAVVVTDCEGAPEHDEPGVPPTKTPSGSGSSTTPSPAVSRISGRKGTQFFTQYFGHHKDKEHNKEHHKHSEAASGIGGGRQHSGPPSSDSGTSTTNDNKDRRPKSRPPCADWDFNWDGRMTDATSPETMGTRRGFYASRELGNVRHILLVRHGQYHEEFKDDKRRVLTPLGRHQAELTGQRLALMARGGLGMINPEFAGPCHIKAIHVSDMARAKETAKIIASHLPGVKVSPPDPMLNEALPAE